MPSIEEFLRQMVGANNLTGIGVNIFPTEPMQFTVYVHWNDGCKGANGNTVSEAAENALEQMRAEQGELEHRIAVSVLPVSP